MRYKAADLPEPFFARRDGSTERKGDSFGPSGHQHASEKIAGSANGFDFGAEIFLGDPTVKTRDRADLIIGQRCHDLTQTLRPNAHVAISQGQYFVLRFPREPRQLVYLAVCAQM